MCQSIECLKERDHRDKTSGVCIGSRFVQKHLKPEYILFLNNNTKKSQTFSNYEAIK